MDSITTKTLRPAKLRNIFLFLVSSIFVIGGVWLARNGDSRGWWAASFFALGVIVAVVNSLPGSSFVRLDSEGFTICSFFRSHTFRWSDIKRFEVARISANKMVVFNFSDTYRRQEVGRKIASAMAGYEGALPESYGLSPEELAKLLNKYRLAAGSD